MGKTTAVQGTNDSSIISKCSMTSKGYFQDDFLKYFAGKTQRRSPLINRGYYIRAKAVDAVFTHFFTSLIDQCGSHVSCQVLSFGAGFDSTYFRMKSKGYLLTGCKYFEIDFPEVVKKKVACIKQNVELQTLVGESRLLSDTNTVFSGSNYYLLGANLEDVRYVQELLESNNVDYNIPTLVLSECVLVYMDVNRSDQLIQWVGRSFHNAMFVTYEQVYPDDGFGIVMQNHFIAIGSQLKSLRIYHNLEAQKRRYLNLGWFVCFAMGMNDFYRSLPSEEQVHFQSLELFDEFEEWHLKCSHYVMVCAAHNDCVSLVPSSFKSFSSEVNAPQKVFPFPVNAEIQLKPTDACIQRFGHQSVFLPNGQLIISGGFGNHQRKHQRIEGLTIIDLMGHSTTCLVWDEEKVLGSRMHHSVALLESSHLLVIGGRSSPARAYEGVVILHPVKSSDQHLNKLKGDAKVESNQLSSKTGQTENCSLQSSLAACSSSSMTDKSLLNCFLITNDSEDAKYKCSLTCCNCTNFQPKDDKITGYVCTKMTVKGLSPCPRWRHTVTVISIKGVEYVVLFGGRSLTTEALDDCYILDTRLQTWTEVPKQLKAPCARHTHSAVAWGLHSVIVTGGLGKNEQPLNTVHHLQLNTRTWAQLSVPGLLPRYSHTSHIWQEKLVLIGGVNAFHDAAPGIAVIDLSSLQVMEFKLPAQNPEHPILCHNHCSVPLEDSEMVLVVGGGGNCFSFGTHLNDSLCFIPLQNLLQKIV